MQNSYLLSNGVSLSSALDKWLAEKERSVSLKTFTRYCDAAKVIQQKIGSSVIAEITASKLQAFFDGFSLAQKTLATHKSVLSMCLGEYGAKDTVSKVSLKRHKRPKTIVPFTEDEVSKLLAVASGDLYDIILLAYRTGMRRGEIFGLQAHDVHDTFLSVRQSVTVVSYKIFYLKEPKTKRSSRRIELDAKSIEMLKRRIANLKSKADFIFGDSAGAYKSPYRLPYAFKKLCISVGVSPRRFHDLRHTHASILLEKGVHVKVVQERLGHKYVSVTLDTYAHLLPTMQADAVKAFNDIR